jgi:hypothetical protein
MSDFVLNLLRRGAGMAPVIAPRLPNFPDELPPLSDAEKPSDELVDLSDAEDLSERPTTPISDAVAPPLGWRGQSPAVGQLDADSPADAEAVETEAAVPATRIKPSLRTVPAALPNLDTPATTPPPRRTLDSTTSASPWQAISPTAPPPTESTPTEVLSSRLQVVETVPPSLPHGESESTVDAGLAAVESAVILSPQPVIPSPAGVVLPLPGEPFPWQLIPPVVGPEERSEEARPIQVSIGRIEIRQAVPPQPPPRRQPRGFDGQLLARCYLDRRWY